MRRKIYPRDVSDDEWAFVAPYLTLLPEEAGQRKYPLRELFNGVRYVVRTGCPWCYLPGDLPPREAGYQQMQRWIKAEYYEAIVHDFRAMLRVAQGRKATPSAAILDSRTLRSTPESGHRAGFDGHKKTKGGKVHVTVDAHGHLLALLVTPANEQDRAQVGQLSPAGVYWLCREFGDSFSGVEQPR